MVVVVGGGWYFTFDEMDPIEFSVLKVTGLAGITSLDLCRKYLLSTYLIHQGSLQTRACCNKTLSRKRAMDTTWVMFLSLSGAGKRDVLETVSQCVYKRIRNASLQRKRKSLAKVKGHRCGGSGQVGQVAWVQVWSALNALVRASYDIKSDMNRRILPDNE